MDEKNCNSYIVITAEEYLGTELENEITIDNLKRIGFEERFKSYLSLDIRDSDVYITYDPSINEFDLWMMSEVIGLSFSTISDIGKFIGFFKS